MGSSSLLWFSFVAIALCDPYDRVCLFFDSSAIQRRHSRNKAMSAADFYVKTLEALCAILSKPLDIHMSCRCQYPEYLVAGGLLEIVDRDSDEQFLTVRYHSVTSCGLKSVRVTVNSKVDDPAYIGYLREKCAAEKVFNQDFYFKKAVKHTGEPMSHLESIASSAVRAAIKVKASVIICFTSTGRAARLIAKYRPTMPVISVVIPRLQTNQLKWSLSGAFEARQSLISRGLFPVLADPQHLADSNNATNESVLKAALDHGKLAGIIKAHDRVVVCQKVGDASVVKIIELED
ncbi:Pyruvate kinase 2, cytosolic, partial [Cucurbita argyrosperma subsp. argyrosperma]